MNLGDVVQVISLLAVIMALLLSVWQNREAARQSASALASLRQATHEELVRYGADFTYDALIRDGELLAWFLASRGFTPSGEVENRKRLFLWVRLDMHEANYHAFRIGAITEDVWQDWLPSVVLDLAMPEAPEVWKTVRSVFSAKFVVLVDDVLAARAATTAEPSAQTGGP